MYTDSTILTYGQYKLQRLRNIPSQYFISIFENTSHDKLLNAWVKENIDRVKDSSWDVQISEPEPTCQKIYFCDEKTAKAYINSRKIKSFKTPIRTYECPKCGAWHLTSIPYQEWKQREKQWL